MDLSKEKINHRVTDDRYKNHLDVMRANYRENPITSKKLPKPLWLRLIKDDELNIIYRDKDILFQNGQIYYASLVQANVILFKKGIRNAPAQIVYSTHPLAEKHPEFLVDIAGEIFSYKGKAEEEIPEQLREVVRIITDEYDRTSVDFIISLPNPENPDERIENIDVHFCALMVFRKDLPNRVLQGSYLPILAAPDFSPAVLILPKEYRTGI